MMMGEAVVSFRPEITENLQYYRKQSAQLASKLRYLSAQFIPYLENNLWLENAMKANISAAKLAEALKQYPQIQFTQKVETNQIFFTIPAEPLKKLQDRYFSICGTKIITRPAWLLRGIRPVKILHSSNRT